MKTFNETRENMLKKGAKKGYFQPFQTDTKNFVRIEFVNHEEWSFDLAVYEDGEFYYVLNDGLLFAKGIIENNEVRKTWEKDFELGYYSFLMKLAYLTDDVRLFENLRDNYAKDIAGSLIPMLVDSIKGSTKHYFGKLFKKAN
jgi:hypothetical protein